MRRDPRRTTEFLRTVIWTLRARHAARRAVFVGPGIAEAVPLAASPPAAAGAVVTVERVLARTRATCLVRSLVVQRWLADHGEPVDVVIGVTAPSAGFRAHAWLDRPAEVGYDGFAELHRLGPPRPLSSVAD